MVQLSPPHSLPLKMEVQICLSQHNHKGANQMSTCNSAAPALGKVSH